MLQTLFFLGVFLGGCLSVPVLTLALALGILAEQGILSLGWGVLLVALGAFFGGHLGYAVGRGVPPFPPRLGRSILGDKRLYQMEQLFARYGDKAFLLDRLVHGFRGMGAVFSGLARMDRRSFVLWNLAGSMVLAVLAVVGYGFGWLWTGLETWLDRGWLNLLATGVVGGLVVLSVRNPNEGPVTALRFRLLWRRGLPLLLLNLLFLRLLLAFVYDASAHERSAMDYVVLDAIHSQGFHPLDQTMRFLSTLGDVPFAMGLTIGVGGLLVVLGHYRSGLILGMTTATVLLLNMVFRVLLGHEVPAWWVVLLQAGGYPFPSGHAMISMAVLAMAAFLIQRVYPPLRWPVRIGGGLLILGTGLSRIYSGVHWPGDVLGGYLAGLLVFALGKYWHEAAQQAAPPAMAVGWGNPGWEKRFPRRFYNRAHKLRRFLFGGWGLLLMVLLLNCGGRTSVVLPPPIPAVPGYVETGTASWYGRKFHGRRTSSGEIYDMYAWTAAHRTLPFQTEVQVTNLDNGKLVKVRINDRGPFVRGRIIDLSYSGALAIGMVGPGTAPVRIQVLGGGVPAGEFAVQVGAFADHRNAQRFHVTLERTFGSAKVIPSDTSQGRLYRVRVGRYSSEQEAQLAARKLRRMGYTPFVVRWD